MKSSASPNGLGLDEDTPAWQVDVCRSRRGAVGQLVFDVQRVEQLADVLADPILGTAGPAARSLRASSAQSARRGFRTTDTPVCVNLCDRSGDLLPHHPPPPFAQRALGRDVTVQRRPADAELGAQVLHIGCAVRHRSLGDA